MTLPSKQQRGGRGAFMCNWSLLRPECWGVMGTLVSSMFVRVAERLTQVD